MKKLLFALLTLTFIITSSQAQLNVDEISKSKTVKEMLDDFSRLNLDVWATHNLKGKIKSYKMTQYKIEKTWVESIQPTDDIKPFFEEKKLASVTFFYDKLSRQERISISDDLHNDTGIIIEYKYKDASTKYEQIKITEEHGDNLKEALLNVTYNSNNKVETASFEERNEYPTSHTFTYKYSSDGNLIEMSDKIGSNGESIKCRAFEYKNGKLIHILSPDKYIYSENNPEDLIIDYKLRYDNKGRLTSLTRDSLISLNIEYDNKGNISREIELGYMNDTSKITIYQYNDLNEEIARTETEYHYATEAINVLEDVDIIGEYNGPEIDYKQYLYGKNITEFRNYVPISITKYGADENHKLQLVTQNICENKFDKQGNFIEQITKNSDGEVIEKIVCEIEYY